MNTPIKLLFEGNHVAMITTFSYETPWASGGVIFLDQEFFQKLIRVSSMSLFNLEMDELDLPDEVEEKIWEKKLSQLGICSQDLQLDRDEKWSIEPQGGSKQQIYAVRFYENSYMDWRL